MHVWLRLHFILVALNLESISESPWRICWHRLLGPISSAGNSLDQRLLLLLFSYSVMSESLWPHGLHHNSLPRPSQSPRVFLDSCPLSQWSHPTISSSVIPFSFCIQTLPASGSFPMSQFFTSSGQNIGASASASVLRVNIQGWFPLDQGWGPQI